MVRFFADFDGVLSRMGAAVYRGELPRGDFYEFTIHDPKKRTIHAACFEDRVFHHAVINLVEPVLDKALTDAVYACRVGKGQHAVIQRLQKHLRRYPWYVKIDIDAYFPSIDHQCLYALLCRRFKNPEFTNISTGEPWAS